MKKNAVVGFVLVIVAGVIACFIASSEGGVVENCVGKAVWYLPYVVLVAGIRSLVLARR